MKWLLKYSAIIVFQIILSVEAIASEHTILQVGSPVRVARGFVGCQSLTALAQVYAKIQENKMKEMGQIVAQNRCVLVPQGATAKVIQKVASASCIGKPGAPICLWMADQFLENETPR